jgi:hypothetical protein
VSRILGKLWMPLLLAGLSAWIAFSNTLMGDYPGDAAPAIEALIHGHLSAYLASQPAMGPLATLAQAPFAALGTSHLAEYQWASFACLLSVVALGLYLARLAARRGALMATQILLPLLCLVNPLTFAAIEAGHPEEILTAALAVAAVASAAEDHGTRAAILLGLAVASKQWAVIAIFPTLMALPTRRVRCGSLAALVVLVLMLPGLIAGPDSFLNVQGHAASGGGIATIWSAWYPAASETALHFNGGLTGTVHQLPSWLEALTHPLIVGLVLAIPLALWVWRGRFGLTGNEAMALLALLAMLRCALDPVNNLYYHEPLLLALIGWDAMSADRLPLRGLAGVAVALFFLSWSRNLGDLQGFNAAYLVVIGAIAIAVARSLPGRTGRRTRKPTPALLTGRA